MTSILDTEDVMERSTKNAFTSALQMKSNKVWNYILKFIYILFISHSFAFIVSRHAQ